MSDYIYFWPDDKPGQNNDGGWQDHANYVPTQFTQRVANGVEPELAADLADDGLPVCDNPSEVAGNGEEVAKEWPGMYEAVA